MYLVNISPIRQVSVSKARAIIVLATNENADQVNGQLFEALVPLLGLLLYVQF